VSRLELQGLVAGRGAFRCGPLSLTALAGARIALLGPNGGGKTTLLKTAAGLLKPVAGSVRIDGQNPATISASDRAGLVAYLPPPGEVESALPARHVAALGRIARRTWPADLTAEDQHAADAALDRFGVGALAGRPFDQLSSGERQLVLLARTTLQEARLCILDEPSATLDPAHRRAVAAALRRLVEDGATVLFSSHDPAEAADADLCILLGEKPVSGPPSELLTPDRLSALYGFDLGVCSACGRAH
jgi:iron complex transport system ATP-binding protein